jgi:hypothetical protein
LPAEINLSLVASYVLIVATLAVVDTAFGIQICIFLFTRPALKGLELFANENHRPRPFSATWR